MCQDQIWLSFSIYILYEDKWKTQAAVHYAERLRSVRNLTQSPVGVSGPYGNRVRTVRTASERQSAVDFPSALRKRFGSGCHGNEITKSDMLNFSAENADGTEYGRRQGPSSVFEFSIANLRKNFNSFNMKKVNIISLTWQHYVMPLNCYIFFCNN